MNGFRIVIAEHDENNFNSISKLLSQEGYLIVARAIDSAGLLRSINTVQPDVVIVNSSIPGENILELLYMLNHLRVAPVVIVSTKFDLNIMEYSIKSGCFGYLIYPIDAEHIIPILEFAVHNFKIIFKLEEENKDLKEQETQRKTIEKAKRLLMQKKKISEEEAYNLLRKYSMVKCVSMHRIAATIIKKLKDNI